MLRIIFSIIAFCAFLSANPTTGENKNTQVSDKEIQNFTNASTQINTAKMNIQKKMQSKQNEKEQPLSKKQVEKYNNDFANEAKQIIEKNGLTIEKYNLMTKLYQNSKKFKVRVQEMLTK
ncbi:MAG: DUF4168 domain-containing protein [Campylobacterota bacterium]